MTAEPSVPTWVTIAAAASMAACLSAPYAPSTVSAQRTAAADCVAIGKPQPSIGYTYEHSQSTGNRSQYTNYSEEVGDSGLRVRTVRPAGTVTQVNTHQIADDVVLLERTSQVDRNGRTIDATVFQPSLTLAIVGVSYGWQATRRLSAVARRAKVDRLVLVR